ncbi:unnamed protein product [Boreogadus saida]
MDSSRPFKRPSLDNIANVMQKLQGSAHVGHRDADVQRDMQAETQVQPQSEAAEEGNRGQHQSIVTVQ